MLVLLVRSEGVEGAEREREMKVRAYLLSGNIFPPNHFIGGKDMKCGLGLWLVLGAWYWLGGGV